MRAIYFCEVTMIIKKLSITLLVLSILLTACHTNDTSGSIPDADNAASDQMAAEVQSDGAKQPVSISDSWADIVSSCEDGSYREKYHVGDTKELDLSEEGLITMKLVAMDADTLTDGSGKAPMTWIADDLLNTEHNMFPDKKTSGGWEASSMRSWLRNEVYALLPDDVKKGIKDVVKYTYTFGYHEDDCHVVVSKDSIWIPSATEVFGEELSYTDVSVNYSKEFPEESQRQKMHVDGSKSWWWLRTSCSDSSGAFRTIQDGETFDPCVDADQAGGVLIGFCLGAASEENDLEEGKKTDSEELNILSDSWNDIIAASNDGTYKEKYKIGDKKLLDLGDEGTITMVLTAIDMDELADGSGKAPMTWISEDLINTERRMDSEDNEESSWENSELRKWLYDDIFPLLPKVLQSNIKEVSKASYAPVNDDFEVITTADTIWIPSVGEINTDDWRKETDVKYIYNNVYPDTPSKSKKHLNGEKSLWWLRTAAYRGGYLWVDDRGISVSDYFNAAEQAGIVICFCL